MSNARIQFSTASEEKWLQVNPVLREGELVIARKANGKRKLVVGKPGGSSYANSEVVWDAEQAETYMNTTKDLSENVNVFVPHIDSSGILTWTNKAGLDNPSPITIKGIKGDPGEKGEPGQRGEQGAQGIQGPRGIQGEQGERGVQGAQGPAGNAATITIGNVTTSAPGTAASVTNRGTSSAAVLDFVLPKGKDGADGGVTVDDTLSDTSTNPVQNKVVKVALDNRAVLDEGNTFTSPNRFDDIYMADGMSSLKWYNGSPNFVVASINSKKYTGEAYTAQKATKDGDGNIITSTYATKTELNSCVKTVNNTAPDENGNVNIAVSGGTNITVDDVLSSTSTNAIQNKAVYAALSNKLNKNDVVPTAQRALQDGDGNPIASTYIKFINGNPPDTSGNVNVSASSGGVSLSTQNTWTAQQNFQSLKFDFEKYTTPCSSGAYDAPHKTTACYNATGAFTLNVSNLIAALNVGESTLFTAYITSSASYTLSITNAGTLKYVGAASDLAITASGLLLNILIVKESSGTITSIVQATKLA